MLLAEAHPYFLWSTKLIQKQGGYGSTVTAWHSFGRPVLRSSRTWSGPRDQRHDQHISQTKQCLRTTKMKLVHNLGEMDEVLYLDLNDHIDIPHDYRTLRNILRSFRVKNNQVIIMMEKTNKIGTYQFLYHENMEKYMIDLLSNSDDHIKDTGD
jgi:hypothetical protein